MREGLTIQWKGLFFSFFCLRVKMSGGSRSRVSSFGSNFGNFISILSSALHSLFLSTLPGPIHL